MQFCGVLGISPPTPFALDAFCLPNRGLKPRGEVGSVKIQRAHLTSSRDP